MRNFSITMESNELGEKKEIARMIHLAEVATSANRSDDTLRANLAKCRNSYQDKIDSLHVQLIEAHAEHEAQMKAQRVKYSELEAQLKAERVKYADLEKENTTTMKGFAKLYHCYLEVQSDFDKTRVVNSRQADQIGYLTKQLNRAQMKLHTTLADLEESKSALANSDTLFDQILDDQADSNEAERRKLVRENLKLVSENLQLSKRNLELAAKNQSLDTECNLTRAELAASLVTMLFI